MPSREGAVISGEGIFCTGLCLRVGVVSRGVISWNHKSVSDWATKADRNRWPFLSAWVVRARRPATEHCPAVILRATSSIGDR